MILQKKLNFFFIVHFIYYCSKCVMTSPEAPEAPVAHVAHVNLLVAIHTHRGVTTEYLFEITDDDIRHIDEIMRAIYNTINAANAASDAAVAAVATVDSATTATATAA
jgi:hypothetical protein